MPKFRLRRLSRYYTRTKFDSQPDVLGNLRQLPRECVTNTSVRNRDSAGVILKAGRPGLHAVHTERRIMKPLYIKTDSPE